MIKNKPRFKEGDILYFKDSEYLKLFNNNKLIDESNYRKYRNTELSIKRVNKHKNTDMGYDYTYGISPSNQLILFDTIEAIDFEDTRYVFNMNMFETKHERRKRIIKEVLC